MNPWRLYICKTFPELQKVMYVTSSYCKVCGPAGETLTRVTVGPLNEEKQTKKLDNFFCAQWAIFIEKNI